MADQEPAAGSNGSGTNETDPQVSVLAQYVKDLSVENPRAPESFQWRDTPQTDVQFNIGSQKINDEITEVELKVTINSKTAQGTAYIVDLSYCGLVGMRNLAEDQAHAFTFAEAPRILFPFARRVIADAVRDAGFAPLMLDPIDFNGLYVQRLQAQQQRGQDAGGAPVPTGEGQG